MLNYSEVEKLSLIHSTWSVFMAEGISCCVECLFPVPLVSQLSEFESHWFVLSKLCFKVFLYFFVSGLLTSGWFIPLLLAPIWAYIAVILFSKTNHHGNSYNFILLLYGSIFNILSIH